MAEAWWDEESPFDDDAPARPRRRRDHEPELPMTQEELDRVLARPPHLRLVNPWLCAFNMRADDGIGDYSGLGYRQCPVKVADPTRNRYCIEHARTLGVDYYSPGETSEATLKETAGSLTRLVPKAVKTTEAVMDDMDAPAGVRLKAASEILDRTGFARGVDVRVDAQVAVVDVTAILKDRLNSLRDAQLGAGAASSATAEVIDETIADELTDGELVEIVDGELPDANGLPFDGPASA